MDVQWIPQGCRMDCLWIAKEFQLDSPCISNGFQMDVYPIEILMETMKGNSLKKHIKNL